MKQLHSPLNFQLGHLQFFLDLQRNSNQKVMRKFKRHPKIINTLSDYGLPVNGNCRRFSINKDEVVRLKKRFLEGDLSQKLENSYLERYTRSISVKNIPAEKGALMAWKAEDKAIVHGIYSLFNVVGTNCVTLGHKILNQLGFGFSKRVSPCAVYWEGIRRSESKGLTTDNNRKSFAPFLRKVTI